MHKLMIVGAAAAAGVVAQPALGSIDYVLDDGSGGFNNGPGAFDAWMIWGNVFDAQAGGETINEVSVSFAGSLAAGTALKIVIFDDPTDDLDPTDAQIVSVTDGVSQSTTVDTFATYAIPEVTVSGTFFVGVAMDLAQGQAAARMDQNTLGTRSWTFFDGAFNTDLSTQGLAQLSSDGPFFGTYMVRARGIPTPGAAGLLAVGAVFAARRRR